MWHQIPQPHDEITISSVIALVDFLAEEGATMVAPGSHLWDRQQKAQPEELVCAEMSAGSVLVFLGSTIHGGGCNSTADKWRRSLYIGFLVGWLRTQENYVLSTPPDVVRTLFRRSQELLGYRAFDFKVCGGGYLGAVNMLDPIDLLDQGKL